MTKPVNKPKVKIKITPKTKPVDKGARKKLTPSVPKKMTADDLYKAILEDRKHLNNTIQAISADIHTLDKRVTLLDAKLSKNNNTRANMLPFLMMHQKDGKGIDPMMFMLMNQDLDPTMLMMCMGQNNKNEIKKDTLFIRFKEYIKTGIYKKNLLNSLKEKYKKDSSIFIITSKTNPKDIIVIHNISEAIQLLLFMQYKMTDQPGCKRELNVVVSTSNFLQETIVRNEYINLGRFMKDAFEKLEYLGSIYNKYEYLKDFKVDQKELIDKLEKDTKKV